MAKVHELIFNIKGNLDSKVNSIFSKSASNVEMLANNLNKLEQQKISYEKYEKLNSIIINTTSSIEKARNAIKPLQSAFSSAQNETKKLYSEWQQAEKKVDSLSMAMAKSTNPTQDMKAALAVAKLEARSLKEEFKNSERNTKTLGNEFNSAQREVTNLERSLGSQKRQLDETKAALKGVENNTILFEKAQKSVERQIKQTSRELQAQKMVQDNWADVQKKTGSFAKTAAVVGGAVAVPLKVSIDSESVMADVAKKVDFISKKEQKEFEKLMRKKIGTDLPLTFENYGNLIASAAGAGIQKSELMDFGVDAAKMSVAFDIEGGEAGSIMAKWRSAFALDQKGVIALADKVNYLGDNSAAQAPEITNIISKVGALGEVAGLNSGQVAAIGAAMVSMGVDADNGATAIKKITTSLTKGADAPKMAEEFYNKMGLTSKQISQGMQDDAEGMILKVLQGIKNLEASEQTSALRNIFGEVSIGAIAPLLQNLEEMERYFGMVDESAGRYLGSMEKEFQTRSATTKNDLIILRNNLSNITNTIGESLLPIFADLSGKLRENAQRFQEWASANPETLNAIVRISAAIGAFLVVGKGVSLFVSVLKLMGSVGFLAFTKISGIAMSVFGFLSSGVSLVSGLFTKLLIPGVKLVGAAFMGLPVVGQMAIIIGIITLVLLNWEKLTKLFKDTIEKIGNWIGGLGSGFKKFGDTVSGIWNGVKNFFTGANEGLNQVNSSANSRNQSVTVGTRGGSISAYASGGIVTRPELAMIGEGGDHEAVIPLNNSKRAAQLWNYTGERLGLLNRSGGNLPGLLRNSSQGHKIDINFEINVDGNSSNVREEIELALANASPRLTRALKQLLYDIDLDNRRVALT